MLRLREDFGHSSGWLEELELLYAVSPVEVPITLYVLWRAGVLAEEEEAAAADAHCCCQKVNMGAAGTPVVEPQDDKKLSKYAGPPVSLPKHSYWFDFWVFVVFDILFFLFIYFVVP